MGENKAEKSGNIFVRFWGRCKTFWAGFKIKHPGIAQFFVFFMLSNGVTILQMVMFAVLNDMILSKSRLADVSFQVWNIFGMKNFEGTPYYMFDYAAGRVTEGGSGGGGLAYFLSMQITLALAQVINFFAQRNITFKSNSNPWYAAMWYAIAYVIISLVAAAALGLYRGPLYRLFIDVLKWGELGKQVANVVVWIITCAISFWVFFPIFKVIFKQVPEEEKKAA